MKLWLDWVTWFDLHEGTAAWVQAVFSVVAILIAVLVPAWQEWLRRSDENAERRRRAQSLALMVNLDVVRLVSDIATALGSTHPALETIHVPDQLAGQINELWHMGPAGGHLIQLIATLNVQNSFARGSEESGVGWALNTAKAQQLDKLARARLKIAQQDCDDALKLIQALLGRGGKALPDS